MHVRRLRTHTPKLLIDGKQQSNVIHTFIAQMLRRKDLRRDDPLRVARSATVNKFIILTRLDKRRHRIHMRREHDTRRCASRRDYIETIGRDLLSLNRKPELLEIARNK